MGTTVKICAPENRIGYVLPEVASVEHCIQFLSEACGHYVHENDGQGVKTQTAAKMELERRICQNKRANVSQSDWPHGDETKISADDSFIFQL
jgi:hypothetical protein